MVVGTWRDEQMMSANPVLVYQFLSTSSFIYRHRVLPTITRIDQWWGGGGGGYCHTDQNNGSLRIYFVVQIPPFIDWTCAGEECRATAEITQSLQINLVLSDMAATSEP